MAAVPRHRPLAPRLHRGPKPPRRGSVALAALLAAVGCGTDAVGVQTCRQIEEARCRRAPACALPLEPPYHTSGTDVDACIRFYDDACLHGLTNGETPSTTELNSCLSAINGTGPTGDDCSIVADPATSSACSWLTPAVTPVASEAGADANADADASE